MIRILAVGYKYRSLSLIELVENVYPKSALTATLTRGSSAEKFSSLAPSPVALEQLTLKYPWSSLYAAA